MSKIDFLRGLKTTQLERFGRRIWGKMTKGMGYQPFGFDAPTLSALFPSHFHTYRLVVQELRSRQTPDQRPGG